MRHQIGIDGSRPGGALPGMLAERGEPGRARRRRRPEIPSEAATPLAATFLGLLLVHNLLPARAADADTDGRSGEVPGGDGGDEASAAAFGALPALGPASAGLAMAIGTAGAAIDPVALTGPAGTGPVEIVVTAAATASAGVPGPVAATTPATAPTTGLLAAGGAQAPVPELASLDETADDGGEEVGPIGRYVRGDGSDGTVVLTDGDDIFVGGDGDERVLGGAGDDYLDGAAGDDELLGEAGDDTLLGGSGDDLLDGGTGDDLLDGGTGDDQLLGGAGDDDLLGGGGDDFLSGGTGIDRLAGGTGNEILVLADVRDAVTELALGSDQGGNDTVVVADGYAASLATALAGTGGRATFVLGRPDVDQWPADVASFRQQIDPDIENIRLEGRAAHDVVGDDGASLIIGNDGANRIHAGGGSDTALGGGGADWIDGGEGDDWLDGGAGADTVYGGAGDDLFVFGLQEDGDLIFDHEGRNTLRIVDADAAKLRVGMKGDDLVVTHDGQMVATIDGYEGHAENFAGIDLGQGVRPFSDFMSDPAAASAARAMAADDWLAGYETDAGGLAEPLPEPWSGLESEWSAIDPEAAAAPLAAAPTPAVVSFQSAVPTGDILGAADLWLPVDDLALAAADPGLAERTAEERPSGG